jgi:hypothetical protein
MIRKVLITIALVAISGVLIFGAVTRTKARNENTSSNETHGTMGYSMVQIELDTTQLTAEYSQGNDLAGRDVGSQSNLASASVTELSDEEAAALLYMREEEKLAHDVYATFSTQWSLAIFQNISQSELTHTDAVKSLLDLYGLADPASGESGIFTNPDLQSLYHDLVVQGGQSLSEALKVGATIEELDILDLQKHAAETTHSDIGQVYQNLMNASYNHLRAYVSTLNRQTGEIYQPQYLDVINYQVIIDNEELSNGNGGWAGLRHGISTSGQP